MPCQFFKSLHQLEAKVSYLFDFGKIEAVIFVTSCYDIGNFIFYRRLLFIQKNIIYVLERLEKQDL